MLCTICIIVYNFNIIMPAHVYSQHAGSLVFAKALTIGTCQPQFQDDTSLGSFTTAPTAHLQHTCLTPLDQQRTPIIDSTILPDFVAAKAVFFVAAKAFFCVCTKLFYRLPTISKFELSFNASFFYDHCTIWIFQLRCLFGLVKSKIKTIFSAQRFLKNTHHITSRSLCLQETSSFCFHISYS